MRKSQMAAVGAVAVLGVVGWLHPPVTQADWAAWVQALGVLALLGAVGLVTVYTGAYNVAATEEHASFTRWAFDTTFHNSVGRRAADGRGRHGRILHGLRLGVAGTGSLHGLSDVGFGQPLDRGHLLAGLPVAFQPRG